MNRCQGVVKLNSPYRRSNVPLADDRNPRQQQIRRRECDKHPFTRRLNQNVTSLLKVHGTHCKIPFPRGKTLVGNTPARDMRGPSSGKKGLDRSGVTSLLMVLTAILVCTIPRPSLYHQFTGPRARRRMSVISTRRLTMSALALALVFGAGACTSDTLTGPAVVSDNGAAYVKVENSDASAAVNPFHPEVCVDRPFHPCAPAPTCTPQPFHPCAPAPTCTPRPFHPCDPPAPTCTPRPFHPCSPPAPTCTPQPFHPCATGTGLVDPARRSAAIPAVMRR